MEHFHFSKGECEQCGYKLKEENDGLQTVNFWFVNSNSRRIPYYLYVCDSCFDTRKVWCKYIYPDFCESCNQAIEDGEHYLDKEVNSSGLAPNEECKVICLACKSA